MSIQQIYNETQNLLSRLSQAQTFIETLEPLQQIEELPHLSADAELLTDLWKKVNTAFSQSQDEIPDATYSNLYALLDPLEECDKIITRIQNSSDMALDLLNLANSVQEAFQKKCQGSINVTEVTSLQTTLTLITKNQPVNTGNRLAIQSLQANIQQLFSNPSPSISTTTTSSVQSDRQIQDETDESFAAGLFADQCKELGTKMTEDAAKNFEMAIGFYQTVKSYCQRTTTYLLPNNNLIIDKVLLDVEKMMEVAIQMQKQAEMKEQGSIASNFQGLKIGSSQPTQGATSSNLQALKDAIVAKAISPISARNNIEDNIEDNIEAAAFSKLSPEDKEKLFETLNSLLLKDNKISKPLPKALQGRSFSIWTSEVHYKMKAVQAILDSQNPKGDIASSNLLELKQKLESALEKFKDPNSDPMTVQSSIQKAFSQLGESEKNALLNSVSAQLIEKNAIKQALPASFVTYSFSMWPGSYQLKLDALLAILPSSSQQAEPIIVMSKKSEDMQKRMLEAKNAGSTNPQIMITSPRKRTSISSSANRTNSCNCDPSTSRTNGSVSSSVINNVPTDKVKELQDLLPYLEGSSSYKDLQQALSGLFIIESSGKRIPFSSTEGPSLIADRPCFHLYYIHKNECPENLIGIDDDRYGNNAMCGVHPTTNSERKRSIQRTIAEVALEGLECACASIFDKNDEIKHMIQILDGLELDARDQLCENQNITHALFGAIYKFQCEALSNDTCLANPNDPQFNNTFGSVAFTLPRSRVTPETKIAAINAIRNSLKTAWKLT